MRYVMLMAYMDIPRYVGIRKYKLRIPAGKGFQRVEDKSVVVY